MRKSTDVTSGHVVLPKENIRVEFLPSKMQPFWHVKLTETSKASSSSNKMVVSHRCRLSPLANTIASPRAEDVFGFSVTQSVGCVGVVGVDVGATVSIDIDPRKSMRLQYSVSSPWRKESLALSGRAVATSEMTANSAIRTINDMSPFTIESRSRD